MKRMLYTILFILSLALIGFIIGNKIIPNYQKQETIWINEREQPQNKSIVYNDIVMDFNYEKNEQAEFGLRADGIVVWRHVK